MITSRTSTLGGIITLALLVSGCQKPEHIAEVPTPPTQLPQPTPDRRVEAPGPWGVYFDLDKSELLPEGKRILDQVVSTYGQYGRSVVNLDGHGDTTGRSQYNLNLGERRSEVVKAYLVMKGIPARIISTETKGERDLMVPTPDDVLERRNRRVEVTFGPA